MRNRGWFWFGEYMTLMIRHPKTRTNSPFVTNGLIPCNRACGHQARSHMEEPASFPYPHGHSLPRCGTAREPKNRSAIAA